MNRRQFIRASLAATVFTGIRPHINANQPGTGFSVQERPVGAGGSLGQMEKNAFR